MASSYAAFQLSCCFQEKPSVISDNYYHFNATLCSAIKPFFRILHQNPIHIDVIKSTKNACVKILEAFVDGFFEFVDQPLLPSQSNFGPVDELGGAVIINNIQGNIPEDFPEGAYIRNGPNPLFGGLKSTKSVFGRSSHTWIEGEGMLHALYFSKESGNWIIKYNNKHVETETYKVEKQRNRPSFLPAIEGDSPAILFAYLLNMLRFGKVNKYLSNTNVFEHARKLYSIAEHHIPQEIDIQTLKTLSNWDICGAWTRPFTSHPKRAPGSGELVIFGVDATKPFLELGIVSADGKKLLHKVDLKLDRCSLCHDIGVTQRYNVIMDIPLTIDIMRLVSGGPLIKYNRQGYARIGVMPRYGDSNSICWFKVEPNCTFHIFNCFEDEHEVIVRGCRALESIIPGPDRGLNKFEWFSRRFKPVGVGKENVDPTDEDGLLFSRCYEWRLNTHTGEIEEKNLTGREFSMDFPVINEHFLGVRNRFGYAQVVDSIASSTSGLLKFGGLAKLKFENPDARFSMGKREVEEVTKVEYHMFEKNTYCSGAAFVSNEGGVEEDDGWIITFVHNEDTNISQVYIIDTKMFLSEPVAKITLPHRVPYGFHGTFMPISFPI